MKAKIVLLFAVLVLVPMSARADLIVNGSFEYTVDDATSQPYGTWSVYDSIVGWTKTDNTSGIEVRNNRAGTAFDGESFVELDSIGENSNSGMYQMVATDPGSSYTLSYYYAPRADEPESSNGIELWFNDSLLGSITGFGSEWSLQSFSVIGTGLDMVKFVAVGDDNQRGGSIDMVSMELAAVHAPEPTSIVLLGSGLGVIGLAAWRRRK